MDARQLRPGRWDLAFEGLVVELDEELHFNRYRRRTLAEPWTDDLPWKAVYEELCALHELRCVAGGAWGGRWTTSSCERHFGPADPPKVFAIGGAPRWKQRALYDAVKDAAALSPGGPRLARLATHDIIEGAMLEDVLAGRARVVDEALVDFVTGRGVGRT